MKKALFASFLFVLLLGSRSVFAQAGALTIDNTFGLCDVNIVMEAICNDCGPNLGSCYIISNSFVVHAGTSTSFTSPDDFMSTVGWSYVNAPITLLCLKTSTEFQWTDCNFSWTSSGYCTPNCLSPYVGGSSVNDNLTAICSPGYICNPQQTVWVAPPGYCLRYVKWTPAAGCYMTNVDVIIHD